MERVIPNLNSSILRPLLGWEPKKQNEKNYIKQIQKFERDCEKSLIETFSRIGINAIVKSDPYSLPYNQELVVNLNGESYLNGPYEFYRVARKIVSEVLEKDLYKVRFYMLIDVDTNRFLGRVTYKFRYHIPKETN